VSSWLDVIAHSASTNPTPAGRADIWITMLEKAMLGHPANKTSEALRLRYLEAIRELRSGSEEETAWTKAFDEIKSENLWVEYIGFRLRKRGAEALESAISRVWKAVDTLGDNEQRKYHARLRIFWRAIVGLREAGACSCLVFVHDGSTPLAKVLRPRLP
jgi:NRDE-2, necessary for RNA interference